MPLDKILQRYLSETDRYDAVLSSCWDGRDSDIQIRGAKWQKAWRRYGETYDLRPKVGLKVTGRSVHRKYVWKTAYDRAHYVVEEHECVQ
ncbi:hypothetical protein M405DRAFT_818418 [Rhizopogon salebrosus TDB-379]|nr:hypothetical protein M405DRAFT_818418 [Rhizopogon salebrosus TDB-379]